MLADNRNHAVMSIVIALLESANQTSPDNPIHLCADTTFLKRYFKSVTVDEFLSNLKELATITTPVMSSKKVSSKQVSSHQSIQIFRFSFGGMTSYFSIPVCEGQTLYLKKQDTQAQAVQQVWCYWLEKIGSIQEIYKKKPTLTTNEKTGRKKFIQDALVFATAEELCLGIDGCLNSPFHMGYKIDKKTGKVTQQKAYCEPCNIFKNRDKLEALMAQVNGKHYLVQLEEANIRRNLRNFSARPDQKDMLITADRHLKKEALPQSSKLQMLMQAGN
ncbi:hypothetical protein EA58_19740 [Photobacterium galatheae]|uniref:Uncharacterized protein n=2 Tax=Photobacterium galatheae TaxID=1654360 RepID=A0A066RI28_9GAMM|nr:hypothetical protein EA58_19740 [Photobacterium galatheae]